MDIPHYFIKKSEDLLSKNDGQSYTLKKKSPTQTSEDLVLEILIY